MDSALNLGVLQHSHQTTHLLNHHMILSWSWHAYIWPSLLLLTPSFLMAHSTTFLGTLSKAFSRSTNAHHSFLCFHLYISYNCLAINIVWVVPVPGLNPNCILSISTACLNLLSRTLSATFIPCSSSLMPRDELHSSTSPLPLYMATSSLICQLSGITSSFTILLQILVSQSTACSPAALIISPVTPLGPAAFLTFRSCIACLTSSLLIMSAGPSTYSADSSSFHSSPHSVAFLNILSTYLKPALQTLGALHYLLSNS